MRPTALVVLLAVACAGSEGPPPPEDAPLVFTRQRGAWTPEELNRDVVECTGAVQDALLADPALAERPPGVARALLRERTVACMSERGWRLGAAPASEEQWSE